MSFLAAALPALISGGMSLFQGHQQRKQERRAQRRMGERGGIGDSFSQPGQGGYDVFSTLNPQQQTLLQQILGSLTGQSGNIQQNPLYQSGQSYLQGILGGDTSKFEAPLMRQFNEQIVPGIAERFSGLGSGAQSSSAFQQALGGAGADLAERLGALRGGATNAGGSPSFGLCTATCFKYSATFEHVYNGICPKTKKFWARIGIGISRRSVSSLSTSTIKSIGDEIICQLFKN